MTATTLIADARLKFFAAIGRVQPEAMRALWAHPLPRSRAIAREWAREWHLDRSGYGPWIEELAQQSEFQRPDVTAYWMPEHDFPPLSLAWDPAGSGETRAAFVLRAKDALDDYVSKVTKWAKANRVAITAAERPTRRRKKTVDVWDLLARRVMLGTSEEILGLDAGVSRPAMAKQLRSLEHRLGVNAT